jgi:hypothetical protein
VDLRTYYWRHCLFVERLVGFRACFLKEVKSLVSRKEGRSRRGKNQGNNKTDIASSSSCRWEGISFDRETSLLRRRNGFQELGENKVDRKK